MEKFKVAYIIGRFPTLTETFVVSEMIGMEAHGATVEVYPLLRGRASVLHSEAEPFAARAHYHRFFSLAVLQANWHFIRQAPLAYFKLFLDVVWMTLGFTKFFFAAIGSFPKAVLFAAEMQRSKVDHIHAHFAHHPTVAAYVVNRLTGIPFSFTGHGTDLFSANRKTLEKKVEAARFVVTISSYNKDFISSRCRNDVRARIHVVHCGVDLATFSPPAERPDGPLRIVSVGSLIDVKGHRHLIDACHLLDRRGIEFSCEIAGEGILRPDLETQIALLDLQHRVRLVGGLTQSRIAEMYRQADVAALTSAPNRKSREGIPVSLMEAMAAGLPVVASAISGIPELVDSGRTGFLTAPGDVTSIADALEALARSTSLRRRLGIAGRAKVSREFNLETNAGKVFQTMIEGSAVPGITGLERIAA